MDRAMLERGFRYAVALAGDPVVADDLLQEGWLRVRRAGGPASSVPYLLRAIRSAWLDGRRGASRGLVDLVEHDGVVGPEAERLIEADALWAGLLTLSPIQREVLFLHLVEGWTTAEIGERTGTPTNTVQSHLRRGRESLQAWLTAEAAK